MYGGKYLPQLQILEAAELSEILSNISLQLPCVIAGFPSPAEEFKTHGLDLNLHLIKNPDCTYFIRVLGDSMIGIGIHSGDILVVDRSLVPTNGRIVIACVDGELFVKRLRIKDGSPYLVSENSAYQPVEVLEEQEFEIWGVAIHCIHSF